MKRILFCSLLFATFFVFPPPGAPRIQAQEGQTARIEARTEAVILDLVVRDEEGRPVRDLKPSELEIYEDGVKQDIISFEFHGEGGVEVQATDEAVAKTPDLSTSISSDPSLQMPNLVTLVFDNLDLEAGRLSQGAAETFVEEYGGPNTWFSVFNVARRLIVLQEFTQEEEKLKEAIEAAVSQSPIKYYDRSQEITDQMRQITRMRDDLEGSTVTDSASGAQQGSDLAEMQVAELIVEMMQYADQLERDTSGRSSLYGLLSLVQGQGSLEGRKTLVYFSRGLHVTANVEALFNTVISEANRKNVSIYSIDARGLMSSGQMDQARDMLQRAVDTSRRQQQQSGGAVTRAEAMLVDRQDDIGRTNVQATLGDLARSTGGVLIANTNDFEPGIERIAGDISAHYELAYTPKDINYDGTFREIEVRVLRDDVEVQSRSGYFALPPTGGLTLLPFERAMLAVLGQSPLPSALDLRSDVMRFDAGTRRAEHTLMLEMPLADLAFRENDETDQYEAEMALFALVKDSGGEVVEKFSQSYPVRGPLDNLKQVRESDVIFIRRFTLGPGSYVLETVAHDQGGARFSAKRSDFEVPELGAGVKLSSLIVVGRTEELPDETPEEDSLQFQDMKIVPNLGEPIMKVEGNKLLLYMVIYPDDSLPNDPKLGLEFSAGGKVIGATQPQLPDRDDQGRIPFIITFPLDYFNPGDYQVRAVVQQGQSWMESKAPFTVALPE